MKFSACLLLIAGLLVPAVGNPAELEKLSPDVSRHRRPVAIQVLDETTAVVANRRGGTLSVVDVEKLSVVAEFDLQGQPTDLAVHGRSVLVTDAEHGRLLAVDVDRQAARVRWELPMPTHPISVSVSPDGRWCSVSCLWSRKVVFVRLPAATEEPPAPQVIATVELPFAPREQLLLAGTPRLLVADAYGDRLAVIHLDSHQVEAIRSLPAHNIRGLAQSADGKQILVSHQTLNERSPPRRSEVVWGMMVSDALRVLQRDKLLDPQADVMDGSRFIMMGNATRGAGDPDALVANDDGRVVIALAGTSEVGVIEPDGYSMQRVAVGRRPVALARVGKQRFVVVNELSDSISRIDLQASTTTQNVDKSRERNNADRPSKYGGYATGEDQAALAVRHLRLGDSPAPNAVERGEAHFFNARLSAGNWYSCHSCHTDGHSSGALADTLGDGHEGAPKRILSLLGVGETGPWAWLGNKQQLHDQVHQSVRLTMLGRQLADREVNDLVEFLKSLDPPPPFQPAATPADQDTVAQGRKLFESLKCNSCHQGTTLTSRQVYDVGLTDDLGAKEFNPPSLRGVGHRYRLFHDNRAASVDEVVRRFKHQLPRPLSSEEQRSLIRYLKSL